MYRLFFRQLMITLPLAVILVAGGCATSARFGAAGRQPLRVGITPDYPPIIFTRDGRVTGVEAELARHLARELGRPLQFITLDLENQIPALLQGQTDIIMSGMTVTEPRQFRIAFSDPYHETGLMTLMRREDAATYDSPSAILQANAVVGVKAGSTAEAFVRQRMPSARVRAYKTTGDAALDLERHRNDLVIHDGCGVAWLASEHEQHLTALYTPLTHDSLAWGMRKSDRELLTEANALLKKLKDDGTLDQILRAWVPFPYLEPLSNHHRRSEVDHLGEP